MEPTHIFPPCSKCPLRNTGELDIAVVKDFFYDSLMASMAHYDLIAHILPPEEQLRYEVKHLQCQMFLGLLRNAKLSM